ncbi:MAG: DUF3788 domain-containing protein [Spirochaetes bacterium]|nr:DUF3788 domain-containing protein [Spirochaetota bacterium]
MQFDRILNKAVKPSEDDILKLIGNRVQLWKKIHCYVEKNYDFKPELVFFTRKYGWAVRYKKSGRTLCYFFPEEDAFSILIVLGEKEAEKVEARKSNLNENIKQVFAATEQLRDGRWIWIRILEQSDLESLVVLLNAKRKPKTGNKLK